MDWSAYATLTSMVALSLQNDQFQETYMSTVGLDFVREPSILLVHAPATRRACTYPFCCAENSHGGHRRQACKAANGT